MTFFLFAAALSGWTAPNFDEILEKAKGGDADAMCEVGRCYRSGYGVRFDSGLASKWTQQAASNGCSCAVGLCYCFGYGTPINGVEAVKWLRKAADEGDGRAMNALGYCYRLGRGVKEDGDEAVKWFRKAADAGDVMAMNNLREYYFNGVGFERDEKEAFKWIRKAAAAGDPGAEEFLGRCYKHGVMVEKNEAEADKWFRKSIESYWRMAESGNEGAMFHLAYCHRNGLGVERNVVKAIKWHQKGFCGRLDTTTNAAAVVEKDATVSVAACRRAAEGGDARAMDDFGSCYEYGEGVERDVKEAEKWYRRAAETGEVWAMRFLGFRYLYGEGVEKNEAEAIVWYRRAAEAGDAIAMQVLGNNFEAGLGVEKCIRDAFKWYQKAANAGCSRAMRDLGRCYAKGIGVEKDIAKAVKWYRLADEAGDVDAMVDLYENGGKEAVTWCRKPVDAGDAWCMYFLGCCYEYGVPAGRNDIAQDQRSCRAAGVGDAWACRCRYHCVSKTGVGRDAREAANWYRKAAEAGESRAMVAMGLSYECGSGVDRDVKEAIKWYRKAVERGNEHAMLYLGYCYEEGTCVEVNKAEAEAMFLKAIGTGKAWVMRTLARHYGSGELRGRTMQVSLAIKLFGKAAELGDAAAMNCLGSRYQHGIGVPKDALEAVKWYRRGAERGDFSLLSSLQDDGDMWAAEMKRRLSWKEKLGDTISRWRQLRVVGRINRFVEGITEDIGETWTYFGVGVSAILFCGIVVLRYKRRKSVVRDSEKDKGNDVGVHAGSLCARGIQGRVVP